MSEGRWGRGRGAMKKRKNKQTKRGENDWIQRWRFGTLVLVGLTVTPL